MANVDDSIIKEVITGRIEPHIYSFETNTLPNLLKVGDSYRPVEERLNEWRRYYKDLTEVSRHKAVVNSKAFFRDYSVHKFLENNGKTRIGIDSSNNIYSNEFFENVSRDEVTLAVQDVVDSYGLPGKYTYYNSLKDKVELHYARKQSFRPRGNQKEVINNFSTAVANGRTNLLMYAVMRFGKSLTSLWCAKEIDSKLTIVVSAKADVRPEWKHAVESHTDFTGYRFMESSDLESSASFDDIYGNKFFTGDGKTEICTHIVLFLTLQDLAGSSATVKKHHTVLKNIKPDLLIIDETHFGARAQVLGKILAGVELSEEDEDSLKQTDGIDELGTIKGLNAINANIKLHLSGTPYRILMGSEFAKEDIIAFVQFSDIYDSKIKWSINNLDDINKSEWDNPYYGFPQMIRFAFNPNESSRKKLESIPGSKPAEIFAPIDNSKNGNYYTFAHEKEVIELLQVLDGTKEDTQLLGLLDHESIKAGKLTRHIVLVLPFRASCDALEKLVKTSSKLFKNLSEYKILNISGHNATLKTPEHIKSAISFAEEKNQKTITLTVNKMLTGTTVPEWDTMIYLKATVSPQEYDQAIFRLQSPWVKNYISESGEIIKYDMKPQTLLVDLDPTRMFFLQEAKALSFGVNTGSIGNENIKQFVERELNISPVLALNAENNKLVEIDASVIIDAVRKYASERSISEDVSDIGVDISLRENEDIYELINGLSEINSKNGLSINPTDDEGEEFDTSDTEHEDTDEQEGSTPSSPNSSPSNDDMAAIKTFEKQFRMYYVLILLFAFLSTTEEKSLADVISNLDANEDNRRIARSLGLKKQHLDALRKNINWSILSSLDYKIQNSDFRANDSTISPVDHINIAINKFGKLSDSEVFTPSHIVEKVYDSFDNEFWTNIDNAKVLDIASKSGSFASGFVKRALHLGKLLETFKDNFYSIPTSTAAYEFTRKMYDALGLNVDNIAVHFNSYDIIDLKNPGAITELLSYMKLSEITKEDLQNTSDKIEGDGSEGKRMKFKAIVGNPPYQQGSDTNFAKPVYNLFFEASNKLGPDFLSLVHPARFLFNAGATPKAWNKMMLNDIHLEIPYYEPNSQDVFSGVDIKGGIVISLWNKNNPSGGLGGVFIPYEPLRSILAKIGAGGFDTVVGPRGESKLHISLDEKYPGDLRIAPNYFERFSDIFVRKKDDIHSIKIIGLEKGNKRTIRYIDNKIINDPKINNWKVFLSESNGSGTFGEALSTPLLGEPGTGCSYTFLQVGSFDSRLEAENCIKYLKSKFCRAMLGTLKITQHNTRTTWKNVPIQDFSSDSDITWSKSIVDIDEQLYAKYGLDEKEIKFIETRVKAME